MNLLDFCYILNKSKKYIGDCSPHNSDAKLEHPVYVLPKYINPLNDMEDKELEVISVYSWHNRCYIITADCKDSALDSYDENTQATIIKETLQWLNNNVSQDIQNEELLNLIRCNI